MPRASLLCWTLRLSSSVSYKRRLRARCSPRRLRLATDWRRCSPSGRGFVRMPLSQPGAEPVETLPAAGPAGDAQTAQSVEPAASGVATAGVLVAGCALLVLRPNLLRATSSPVPLLVAVFSFVGMVGAWWPLPSAGRGSGGVSAGMAVAVGVGGFALGRMIGGGHSPGPLTLHVVILNSR